MILSRVIKSEGAPIPPAVAELLLKLDFPASDHARFAELSLNAQEGTLTDAERRELEGYLEVDSLLSLLRLVAKPSLGVHA